MYLIYVDESGTPSWKDPNPWYILASVIVNERKWDSIEIGIEKIKTKHFASVKKIDEIHSGQMYARKGVYSHLSSSQVESVFEDVFDLISNSEITLISVIIDKQKLFNKDPNQDPQFLAWKYLTERMDMFVTRQWNSNQADWAGLIIMDESQRHMDDKIRKYIQYLRQFGSDFQKIQSIIEDPIFTPLHWRNYTQLADCVSYCCLKNELQDPFFQKQFKKIYRKFDDGDKGIILGFGLKKYP